MKQETKDTIIIMTILALVSLVSIVLTTLILSMIPYTPPEQIDCLDCHRQGGFIYPITSIIIAGITLGFIFFFIIPTYFPNFMKEESQ